MRPKRIILIRHGESEGNIDQSIYHKKPDYAVELTEKGQEQAIDAGEKIAFLIEDESVCVYSSPFYRTRETLQGIEQTVYFEWKREDPRLREQEWSGRLLDSEIYNKRKEIVQARDDYGSFFYRFDSGESCADVFDRVSSFFDTLHRDFRKDDYPENCVIVTHGMLIRVFLMRWFHLTVEEFEALRNPPNASITILENQGNGKYKLAEEYPKYEIPTRKY